METTSQDGTKIKYQTFIQVNLELLDGHTMSLFLTKEEYESFNKAIENGATRWRLLQETKDGRRYWRNEWVFLQNVNRITYSENLLENGLIVETRSVSI